jgi:hypothetical protein
MISYPDTLPGPSALGLKKADRRATSSMEGAPHARGRQLAVVTSAKISWDLSQAQLDDFLGFYFDTLAEGRRSFKIRLHGDGGKRLRIAKFTAPLSQSATTGGGYTVSSTLELTD